MTHADWLILGYTTVIIIFGIVCYHCRSILSPESIFFPVSALFFMLAFRYQFKQSDITHHCRNAIFKEINQVLRVILS